jgi:hypothetical protein
VPFPKNVEINRPKDEYGVVLTVVKADINKTLTDAQFTLDQPPGTQLRTIGAASEPTPAPTTAAKKGNSKR